MNPMQSMNVSKPGDKKTDDEASRTSSVNSVLTKVNDTILDNIVNRFSLVDNHKVRGKWRTVMTIMVVTFPVTVFVVMMWYFLYKGCTPSQVVYEIAFEQMVTKFLKSDGVHYCAAAASDVVSFYNYYYYYPENLCCYLSGDHANYDLSRQCSFAYDMFNACTTTDETGSSSCYDSGLPVTIYYAQCASVSTSLVLSAQYAVYATVSAIYFYFFLRVCKKYGVCGLFKWNSWSSVMNNKEDWTTKPTAEIV